MSFQKNQDNKRASSKLDQIVPNIDNGSSLIKFPKKGNFRQRAHANPFSDHDLIYPLNPSRMNWLDLYPEKVDRKVEILDIGCGYGGLLVSLSPIFHESLILGLEIRQKVVEYVQQRIVALRSNSSTFSNIAIIKTNSMKYSVNFITKAQISHAFILFPDPHFKRKKHKARIITSNLLAEYAYLIKNGGKLYIATDVKDLFIWMSNCIKRFPLFKEIVDNKNDPCINLMLNHTEESFKVVREGRDKYFAVYQRI